MGLHCLSLCMGCPTVHDHGVAWFSALGSQDGDIYVMFNVQTLWSCKLTRPNVSDGKLRTSLYILGLLQVQRVYRVGMGTIHFLVSRSSVVFDQKDSLLKVEFPSQPHHLHHLLPKITGSF